MKRGGTDKYGVERLGKAKGDKKIWDGKGDGEEQERKKGRKEVILDGRGTEREWGRRDCEMKTKKEKYKRVNPGGCTGKEERKKNNECLEMMYKKSKRTKEKEDTPRGKEGSWEGVMTRRCLPFVSALPRAK